MNKISLLIILSIFCASTYKYDDNIAKFSHVNNFVIQNQKQCKAKKDFVKLSDLKKKKKIKIKLRSNK
jgi:hypothetical protein